MWLAEMTLSGNEEKQWMQWEKVSWKGVDDDFIDQSKLPFDKSD